MFKLLISKGSKARARPFMLAMAANVRIPHRSYSSAAESTQLPTHSKLRRNFLDFHKTYDTSVAGPLSTLQIEEYYINGYLLVPNLLPKPMIDNCLSDIELLVDKLAHDLHKNGLIADACICDDKNEKYNVFTRLTALEAQYPGSAVLIHKAGVLQPSFSALWESPQLTDIAGQLLLPHSDSDTKQPRGVLEGHPVWNLRAKVPSSEEATVPWHQDFAYLDECAWNTHQLAAWVPLLDIRRIHGPMELLKYGHLPGNVGTHTCCAGNTWYLDLAEQTMREEIWPDIPAELLAKDHIQSLEDLFVTADDMDAGAVLFLNQCIPHRSHENYSEQIRWSLDLRWQKHGQPNGLDLLKPSIKMRDFGDPEYKADWTNWGMISRTELQMAAQSSDSSSTMTWHTEDDETSMERFNPVIAGPWMGRWEIVHHNKHTRAFS